MSDTKFPIKICFNCREFYQKQELCTCSLRIYSTDSTYHGYLKTKANDSCYFWTEDLMKNRPVQVGEKTRRRTLVKKVNENHQLPNSFQYTIETSEWLLDTPVNIFTEDGWSPWVVYGTDNNYITLVSKHNKELGIE